MSFLSSIKRLAVWPLGLGQSAGARRSRRAALGVEGLEDRFAPAVLTVTSLADSVSNPAPGTLRAAVLQANSDAANAVADTVQFAAGLTGTITLGSPLELTASAMLTEVIIDGGGTITLSGGGTSQVFQVDVEAHAVLSGLTISNGTAAQGGAISNAGTLTLNSDSLSGNTATQAGGAIDNTGSLTITGCTLSGNSAQGAGGAIDNSGPSTGGGFGGFGGGGFGGIPFGPIDQVTITGSTLSGNTASSGGAVENVSGPLTLSASTLMSNSAAYGGALDNDSAATLVVNQGSTLLGNSASWNGGAIDNRGTLTLDAGTLSGNAAYYGGGLYNQGSATVQDNSTLSGDRASWMGGAIDNYGSLSLSGGTLSGNAASYGGGAVANEWFATMSVAGAAFTGNAADIGGAVFNAGQGSIGSSTLEGNSAAFGGALINYGTLALSANTLSGNVASQSGGAIDNYGTLTMNSDAVSGNTALQGGGIWNGGWLSLTGDEVWLNHLRPATTSDSVPPLGTGLYNASGSVSLNGTFIAYNFNEDGSFGGDTYGV
jgi:hypothetical protein